MASSKSTPKDAQVMSSILREIGIQDYEPRVLNQMLEFCYRYVTNIVDDAQLFSSYAKRKSIDVDDIKVATEFQSDKYFTNPPPREMLISIARQKNNTPLPLIKATTGIRLPPDRYSLTACNYKLKCISKKNQSRANKFNPVGLNGKSALPMSLVSKPASTTATSMFSRGLPVVTTTTKTLTPIIKFSDGNRNTLPMPTPISIGNSMPSVIKSEAVASFPEHGEKRKLEDDDYDED